MKGKVNDELKKHFRPEFLNRIDDIVVFHQLTKDEIVQMVDLLVGRVSKSLAERDMDIELTDKARNLLADRGFDPVLGARPLRRTIQREIEDHLSEKILFGEIGAGEIISVDVEGWDGESKENKDATFTFTPRPKPLPEDKFGPSDSDSDDDGSSDVTVRENDPDTDTDTDTGSGNGGSGNAGGGTDTDSTNDNGPDRITPDTPAGSDGGSDGFGGSCLLYTSPSPRD